MNRAGKSKAALSTEAVAFILDLGLCPGSACPLAVDGCDPGCQHLRSWVEEVSGG